jgi:hypothetical protein
MVCAQCGAEVAAKRSTRRFCSSSCRVLAFYGRKLGMGSPAPTASNDAVGQPPTLDRELPVVAEEPAPPAPAPGEVATYQPPAPVPVGAVDQEGGSTVQRRTVEPPPATAEYAAVETPLVAVVALPPASSPRRPSPMEARILLGVRQLTRPLLERALASRRQIYQDRPEMLAQVEAAALVLEEQLAARAAG